MSFGWTSARELTKVVALNVRLVGFENATTVRLSSGFNWKPRRRGVVVTMGREIIFALICTRRRRYSRRVADVPRRNIYVKMLPRGERRVVLEGRTFVARTGRFFVDTSARSFVRPRVSRCYGLQTRMWKNTNVNRRSDIGCSSKSPANVVGNPTGMAANRRERLDEIGFRYFRRNRAPSCTGRSSFKKRLNGYGVFGRNSFRRVSVAY